MPDPAVCPRCGGPAVEETTTVMGHKFSRLVCQNNCAQKEKEAEAQRKEKESQHRRAMKFIRWNELSRRQEDCWFENFKEDENNKQMFRFMRKYAQEFDSFLAKGMGAILMGAPGTGKTHLATAVFREIAMQNKAAVFIRFTDLLTRMDEARSFTAQMQLSDMVRFLCDADLLVLDDVGAVSMDNHAKDFFYKIIDGRYQSMRPVVITTNFNAQELALAVGSRLYDRLSETCFSVATNGDSVRPQKRNEAKESLFGAIIKGEDELSERKNEWKKFVQQPA